MPSLVYTITAYTPFTKILSANVNQDKTDIQNRLNWSGTVGDAATGLDGSNIQSYTALAEVKAAVTTQGVTLTAASGWGANGNNITIAFTAGGVAGSEIVSVVGSAISVQISSGVSTVTQVVTALNSSALSANIIAASGSSSSTVAAAVAVSLTGGVNGGGLARSTKLALDSANYVVINNTSGQMSSEAQLSLSRGGTGSNLSGVKNVGDVLQWNGSSLVTGSAPVAPQSKIISFYYFY